MVSSPEQRSKFSTAETSYPFYFNTTVSSTALKQPSLAIHYIFRGGWKLAQIWWVYLRKFWKKRLTCYVWMWRVSPELVLLWVGLSENIISNSWRQTEAHEFASAIKYLAHLTFYHLCYHWALLYKRLRGNWGSVGAPPGRQPAGCMWREPRPGPQTPAWSQNHRARCPWLLEQPPVQTQSRLYTGQSDKG